MRSHKVFLLTVLVFAAIPARAADRATARAELEANRVKWHAAGIHDYEIRLRDDDCWCVYGPYYGPIRNIVRADELEESFYEGERRDGYWYGRKVRVATDLRATVEDVFARVERVLETAPEGTFRVVYDATYGFPALVEFDDPAWEDEQWRLVVDGFKPLASKR